MCNVVLPWHPCRRVNMGMGESTRHPCTRYRFSYIFLFILTVGDALPFQLFVTTLVEKLLVHFLDPAPSHRRSSASRTATPLRFSETQRALQATLSTALFASPSFCAESCHDLSHEVVFQYHRGEGSIRSLLQYTERGCPGVKTSETARRSAPAVRFEWIW